MDGLAVDVGGRKRAPLTLEQAIYLRPVQAAVLAVLEACRAYRWHRETPHQHARRLWATQPREMTRLHSALPLAEARTFTMMELIDFYVSDLAGRV